MSYSVGIYDDGGIYVRFTDEAPCWAAEAIEETGSTLDLP